MTHEYSRESAVARTAKAGIGGTVAEAVAAAGAVTLAILGLVQIYPVLFVSIATIAIGAALLLHGASIAGRFRAMLVETPAGSADTGVGVTAEFVGGLAGIALGILALIDILPGLMVPIAAIVFGAVLVFDSGITVRLAQLPPAEARVPDRSESVLRQAAEATSGLQVLVGLGVAALGILALLDYAPLVLSLVAMLSVGGFLLLKDTAVGSRLYKVLPH
jgi:hypothetical protein